MKLKGSLKSQRDQGKRTLQVVVEEIEATILMYQFIGRIRGEE